MQTLVPGAHCCISPTVPHFDGRNRPFWRPVPISVSEICGRRRKRAVCLPRRVSRVTEKAEGNENSGAGADAHNQELL
jgi:hypothetical protein